MRAIEIYEELGDFDRLAWVLNNLGGYVYLDGHWDEALALAERAREAFEKVGDENHATIAALNIAEVRSDQGRYEEAEPVLREVLEVRRAGGIPLEVAEAASVLGRHAARVGNVDEARTLLEEARTLYAAEADEVELLTTDARIVEALVAAGAGEEALALAAEALTRGDDTRGLLRNRLKKSRIGPKKSTLGRPLDTKQTMAYGAGTAAARLPPAWGKQEGT